MTKDLHLISYTLTDFIGDSITLLRTMELYVTFGSNSFLKIVKIKFLEVNILSAYDPIIGHLTLNRIGPLCQPMTPRFPTSSEIGTLNSD